MNKSIIAGLFLLLACSRGFSAEPTMSLTLSDSLVCSGEAVDATASISPAPPYTVTIVFTDDEGNTIGSGTSSSGSVTVSGISFNKGARGISATCDRPDLSASTCGDWIKLTLDPPPISNVVEIRCDGDWPLTVSFALDDDESHTVDDVTWSVAETGGPTSPPGDASVEDPDVGTINVGTVPSRLYIVTATSSGCNGTSSFETTVDCDCTHHVSDGVDLHTSVGCNTGVTDDPVTTSFTCGDLTAQCILGYATYTVGGVQVGRCTYFNSNQDLVYWKCKCGNKIVKTYYQVTRTAAPNAANAIDDIGKLTTWNCGEVPQNKCFIWKLSGGIPVPFCRDLSQQDLDCGCVSSDL